MYCYYRLLHCRMNAHRTSILVDYWSQSNFKLTLKAENKFKQHQTYSYQSYNIQHSYMHSWVAMVKAEFVQFIGLDSPCPSIHAQEQLIGCDMSDAVMLCTAWKKHSRDSAASNSMLKIIIHASVAELIAQMLSVSYLNGDFVRYCCGYKKKGSYSSRATIVKLKIV